MNNRFSGDPAIKITPDGADMVFDGGQPVMDMGFHNAVQISVMTDEGYWGNALETDPARQIGSDFMALAREPITGLDSLTVLNDALARAFMWFKDKNIAQTVETQVTNPRSVEIKAVAKISPQGQDDIEVGFIGSGLNWQAQINDPAAPKLER